MSDTFWGGYSNALGAIAGVGQQVTNRQTGARLRNRDYAGAANAQFDSGNVAGGIAAQNAGAAYETTQREAAARTEAEQIAFTRQAVKALKESQNPLADFDSMVPAFRQLGTDDAQINQLRQDLQAGGRQFLDTVQQVVDTQERELSFQKAGDRLLVFEDGNPNPVNDFAPALETIEVGGVLVDPVTYQPLVDTREPKIQTIQNSDGSSSIVQIDQPAPATVAPARSGGGGADPIEVIQSILPNARFTSGLRTSEQNRAAGGANNSFHLRGQAVDIAPPAGVSIADFRRQLESSGVQVKELLNEGDHWHVAWEGGSRAPNIGRGEPVRTSSGGVRVVASGANNGPTPAAARAEDRESRIADRQGRQDSRQLRRDFEALPAVKEFGTIRDSYNQVQALARSGTNTDDVALTYSFMRMLDPTSVVREGEYALVGRANNLPGRVQTALARIDSGESLTPDLRQAMVQTAQRVYQERQSRYNEVVQQYRGYAEEDGFDPDRVVPLGRGSPANNQRRTNAPGLPFDVSPGQLQTRQRLSQSGASPSAPVGSERNPRYMNPADPNSSWTNARSGDYLVRPDGRLVRKP